MLFLNFHFEFMTVFHITFIRIVHDIVLPNKYLSIYESYSRWIIVLLYVTHSQRYFSHICNGT